MSYFGNKNAEDFKESELIEHKAEYEVTKDYIVFYPSPHLKKEDYAQKELTTFTLKELFEGKPIEGIFENKTLVDTPNPRLKHGFLNAAALAWSEHYPFAIKPIDIWLLILQAIALHVGKHSEELRTKWVKHDGKKELHVVNDSFVLHSLDNDWASVIDAFSEQIDENATEDTMKLLNPDYSHVSKHELISVKVTIMDICKNYFEYIFHTRCGFPKIYLYGNQEDWKKLKDKTKTLLSEKCNEKFAQDWNKQLLPILDEFIKAYDGEINSYFWNKMIKQNATRGSGARTWFSGWINVFFPYIGDKSDLNPFCFKYDINEKNGADLANFPEGISKAPVTWDYLGTDIPLQFNSGFIGVEQDKDLTLKSVIGWFIEAVDKKDKKNDDAKNDK